VTGEGVQVHSPKEAGTGCSMPVVALPECDLLELWLLALQERTPTAPVGTWELSAAPGAAPGARGQWTLTMSASNGPFERSYDPSCRPMGRTAPVAPVDAAKYREQRAAGPTTPGPDLPPGKRGRVHDHQPD